MAGLREAAMGETLAGPLTLLEVVAAHKRGEPRGIWSCCSAHPYVLTEVFRAAAEGGAPLLIESTCNQVNQDGGYTGVTPDAFAAALRRRAESESLPPGRVLYGGDHLGPHPWRGESAAFALEKAAELVRQYVGAGAAKIHLDASMRLADDPPGPLDPALAAHRTAELCAAAEAAWEAEGEGPAYVIGTEVPPPGGEGREAPRLRVTDPDDAARTLDLVRSAFRDRALESAWERVVGLVVQPGVEFGDAGVHDYDPRAAGELTTFIEGVPGIVFEAHSTDFQTEGRLRDLVRGHFAILKVGPALTFAFREAVFALAALEDEWLGRRAGVSQSRLREVVDGVMRREPLHWRDYYRGDEARLRLSRRYSLCDRIRYYWPQPEVEAALGRLLLNLEAHPPPLPLYSQYLPGPTCRVRERGIEPSPRHVIGLHIREVIDRYARACGAPPSEGAASPQTPAPLS